jgi:hypothetical protein
MTLGSSIEKVKLPAAPTRQRVGLQCLLFVALAACVSGSQGQEKQEPKKAAPAQEKQQKKADADEKKEADRKAAIKKEAVRRQAAAVRNRVVRVQNQWTDENFDQWIFQQDRNPAGARRRLDSSLILHLEAIDRSSQLTEAQREKLRLAARGDIKRFFDRYETAKQKFQLVKDDQQKMQQIWQDISPLQTSMQAGLFDGDSLFYKSLHNTLTGEQWAKCDAVDRERREFSHRTSIVQAVNGWEQSMPLRDAQRRELITLLTRETKPPRKLTPYGSTWIQFQLSHIPQEKLKPIFDDIQWKTMHQYLANAKNLGQFVKQLGLLDEEADRADAQPPPAKK